MLTYLSERDEIFQTLWGVDFESEVNKLQSHLVIRKIYIYFHQGNFNLFLLYTIDLWFI